MRTNSLRAVITTRLNASQKSRVGVVMNRSAKGEILNVLNSLTDWIPRCIRTYLYFTLEEA